MGTGRMERLPGELRKWASDITRRLPFAPAAVTWIRLLGAPAVLVLIYRSVNAQLLFWIILLCSLSDYFDGWLARRLRKTSYPGKVLDFIADKLFLSVTLFSLSIISDLINTTAAEPSGTSVRPAR